MSCYRVIIESVGFVMCGKVMLGGEGHVRDANSETMCAYLAVNIREVVHCSLYLQIN